MYGFSYPISSFFPCKTQEMQSCYSYNKFLHFLANNKNIMSTKSYDQFGLNNYISLVVVLFIIVIILKLNASLVYLQR